MDESKRLKKIVAAMILALLIIFLIAALLPFINAFFGAFIFYIVFKPLYDKLRVNLKLGEGLSAWIVLILSFIVVILPLLIFIPLLISQSATVIQFVEPFIGHISAYINSFTGLDFQALLQTVITKGAAFLKTLLVASIQGVTKMLINLTIMYFVLYYLLVNKGRNGKTIEAMIPFNVKHTKQLAKEFHDITHSTIISTGLIALIQSLGILLTFLILGIPGAFFWGFISFILSFLPIVGVALVWIPVAAMQFIIGNNAAGIPLVIVGIVLSNIDNVLRPIIHQKFAKMHPLVTLIGVLIGIPYFGIIGLIVGPLLLSYFFLMVNMFKIEYLS